MFAKFQRRFSIIETYPPNTFKSLFVFEVLGGKGSCGVIQPYILYPIFQVKKNTFLVIFKTNPAIVKEK